MLKSVIFRKVLRNLQIGLPAKAGAGKSNRQSIVKIKLYFENYLVIHLTPQT